MDDDDDDAASLAPLSASLLSVSAVVEADASAPPWVEYSRGTNRGVAFTIVGLGAAARSNVKVLRSIFVYILRKELWQEIKGKRGTSRAAF